MSFYIKKDLLAFVHIEKAAGTTLVHILRSNFFMRYCDVMPLDLNSRRIFCANDFKKVMLINPFVKCIAGHAVSPTSDLLDMVPSILFITILRNPINRYISHYQYWVERMNKRLTFEQFLKNKGTTNFQTKKVAGSENLSLAKTILSKNFFLVGIVEEFDQFLIFLKRKMKPFDFKPKYKIRNVANKRSPIKYNRMHYIKKYKDDIINANRLDLDLYKFTRENLLRKEKEKYGKDFQKDLNEFYNSPINHLGELKRYADYFFRKCYYEPIVRIIRKSNGLPAKGSY